uniref:Retrotransposon gag domain-containing protein n=1 Tax=Cajanus cajan TaxID=3821 RepID=A0A151TWI0_CAJCA|nr:hypothetical protein KK1_010698 [Cajanus cajan]
MRKQKRRSRSSHSQYSSPNESLNMGNHYQPPPRRTIKPREVKVDLPQFFGNDDVESYLDWEMKVEQLFACHKVSEERKVPLATLSFQGHAMYWSTTLERERHFYNDPPIQYWNDLNYYVARFFSGLNLEIRDQVELLPYRDLNDLVQLCVKSSFKRESSHSSSLRKDHKREGKHIEKKKAFEPSKDLVREKGREKGKEKGKDTPHTSSRTSDIKFFKCLGRGHIASQCPTKKVIIMRVHDNYSSQKETTTSSSDSEEEASEHEENVEVTFPYEGELLMIRRLLNNQPSGTISQRENIFHTRCNVLNNACSLIVDSGLWCNCCSTRLVEKLGLTTSPHPKPYQLHWLNEDGDLIVDQQVKVKLSIGKYEDEVLCDIVPMEACHILLGRS